jgi:chromosome partitioning protein
MTVILVANSKGGAGKSTVASNLAGFYAAQGERPMLGDLDRQQSLRSWLERRPSSAAPISSWEQSAGGAARPPGDATHIILDSPAGLEGAALRDAARHASKVIVPLQPSLFDIQATHRFLTRLADVGVNPAGGRVALLATRVDPRTRAAAQLDAYVKDIGVPFLGYLRDTQLYVQLAAQGLTLWDIAPSRVAQDVEQWLPVIHWASNGRRTVQLAEAA